jgi:DNA replication protein DnaC
MKSSCIRQSKAYRLLIIDEIGYTVNQERPNLLLQVIAALALKAVRSSRYQWDTTFAQDTTLTAALLMIASAPILPIAGELPSSIRRDDA